MTRPDCSVKIRQNRPFVLDFSNEPMVMFTQPVKDTTFKPGATVRIGAGIIDPALNILLRGVADTRQKTGERTYTDADGNKVTVPKYASLDPTVAITNSKGEEVASGKMPFG